MTPCKGVFQNVRKVDEPLFELRVLFAAKPQTPRPTGKAGRNEFHRRVAILRYHPWKGFFDSLGPRCEIAGL